MLPPLALSPEHPSTLAIHGLLRHIDACLAVVPKVALVCGYQHVGHFSRDFKARLGINPSQARRA